LNNALNRLLDPGCLIAQARAETGLHVFGEPSLAEPLEILAGALQREAGLTEQGLRMWHERLLNFLCGRLRAQHWFTLHPEILTETIGAPLVILGLARTGSTLLHRLFASDARFYSTAWWEGRFPVPTTDDIDGSQRIATAQDEVAAILAANPALKAIHPWDPLGADEDNHLLDLTLMSTTHEAMACVPSYHAWIAEQDLRAAYGYWKKMLQLLQWQKKRRGVAAAQRWVLKTPVHLGYVDIIAGMFPDSVFIQTHRDPLSTIPSYASMVYSLWLGISDAPDAVEAGRQTSATLERNLKRCLEVRSRLPQERFFDVDYRETVRDPTALIERLYRQLELPMTAAARTGIATYLHDNPREQRPPHHYTLAQFGFTEADIKHRFRAYRRQFIDAGA
jgi:hypothetical protein